MSAGAAAGQPVGAWRLAVAGLVLLLVWEASGLDLAVMQLVAGPDGFAWRDHLLTRGLLHEGGRWLSGVMLTLLVINLWRPLIAGPTRRERAAWLATTLACLALVSLLKSRSATSCPWDLAAFGGIAHYVPHWRFGIADGGPGHCFPSGHASAAFAFVGGFFVLRHHSPTWARRWLAAVVGCGLLFGAAQTLRGAHYPSHTLWTAWLCWVTSLVLAPRAGIATASGLTTAPAR